MDFKEGDKFYKAGNYSNNNSSTATKTSSDFGGDWTQGNDNFSYNKQIKAKNMAKQFLDKKNV